LQHIAGLLFAAVPLLGAAALTAGVLCGMLRCRTLYAFSRDGAVPLSWWWSKVNPRFEAPVNAVW
jgi:amino acid transporter